MSNNKKSLAKKIKDDVARKVFQQNIRPNLAIIFFDQEESDGDFVNKIKEEAIGVGIDVHIYKCEEKIFESEVEEMIKYLNTDPILDAIYLKLPLPDEYNTEKLLNLIDVNKFLEIDLDINDEEMEIANLFKNVAERAFFNNSAEENHQTLNIV